MRNILVLISGLLLATPIAVAEDGTNASAGAPLESIDGVFLDTVDVNIVNVDVYVTDKKGNRITGLTKDDFELYEDGKPVVITNFYAVEEGTVKEGGIPLEPLDELAPPENFGSVAAAPEDQRLSLIVYVDNFNLHPFSRNRAFSYVRSFLRQKMKIGDRVMLVSYDRTLNERQPWTQDPELVASALYDLEDKSAHRVHWDSDRRDLLEAIFEADRISDVRGRVQTYAENLYNDMRFTIKALRDLVEHLAGLPGRKAILYISDGLAMRTGEDLYYALDEKFRNRNASTNGLLMEAFRFDLTRDFQQLTRIANSNRVTFYTLDAEGLRTYSYYDVRNAVPGGSSFVDQTHFHNLQAPLQMLAEETGGFAMINTNNFSAPLARMGEDFTTYYSLGYSPATTASGRFHEIEVKVKNRKGVVVRHRSGFRNKPLPTRMSEGTLAALYHGYESNPIGARLDVGNEVRRDDGYYDVPLTIRVPIKSLELLPLQGMYRGRLRFYIAARDSEGGMSPVQDIPVPIDIQADQLQDAREKYYAYDLTLMMRRGGQRVAVGIHDEIGADTAFISTTVFIGRR